VIQQLSPLEKSLQEKLAQSPSPNLVKSHDIGEPTDYNADYSWHSLKKERVTALPFSGCLGLVNPNTELYYLVGFSEGDEEAFPYRPDAKTVLHGIDYLCEEADLGDGLEACTTFMPFSGDTLMAFVELRNEGKTARDVRIHQGLAKEVFSYHPNSTKMPCRMRGVYVATRGMGNVEELGNAGAVQFEEWENFGRRSNAVLMGHLLAYMGADLPPLYSRPSRPGPEAARENAGPYEPSRIQSYQRAYEVNIPPGNVARLTTYLSLRRYKSGQNILYP